MKNFVQKFLPFLLKECPSKTKHWVWERYCYCNFGQSNFRGRAGGVYNFKTKQEEPPEPHEETVRSYVTEFFDWQEKHHPLKTFWEFANSELVKREKDRENYPYSYWRQLSEKALERIILDLFGEIWYQEIPVSCETCIFLRKHHVNSGTCRMLPLFLGLDTKSVEIKTTNFGCRLGRTSKLYR